MFPAVGALQFTHVRLNGRTYRNGLLSLKLVCCNQTSWNIYKTQIKFEILWRYFGLSRVVPVNNWTNADFFVFRSLIIFCPQPNDMKKNPFYWFEVMPFKNGKMLNFSFKFSNLSLTQSDVKLNTMLSTTKTKPSTN